jgi:hypothetical protein
LPKTIACTLTEHRLDGAVELLAGVLREVDPGVLLDDALVGGDQRLQLGNPQLDVRGHACVGLGLVDGVLEVVPLDVKDGLAEHLDQAPVGVPREALVLGELGQAGDGCIAHADVEDRLHHPGHRELRTGAHRDQQRVGRVTQRAPDLGLEAGELLGHLLGHLRGDGTTVQVGPAGIGRHREARGDVETDLDHLGEVGALSAEQVLLVLVALGEVVDITHVCGSSWDRG